MTVHDQVPGASRKVGVVAVLLMGLLWMGWVALPAPAQGSTATAPLLADVGSHLGRQAFSVRVAKKKAGWAVVDSRVTELDGKKALLVSFEMRLKMVMFGETNEMSAVQRTWYGFSGRGRILRMTTDELQDGQRKNVVLQPATGGYELTTIDGKRKTRRRVATPRDDLRQIVELTKWLESGPAVGSTRAYWVLDPEREDINQKEEMKYRGTQTIVRGGVPARVFDVDMKFSGMTAKARLSNFHTPLSLSIGGMMEMVAQPESVAKSPSSNEDMTLDFSVVLAKGMGDRPDGLTRVVLGISGLGDFALPQDHRQQLRKTGSGVELVLRKDFRKEVASPLDAAGKKKWTAPEIGIESDDVEIVKRAAALTKGVAEPVAKAARLQHWVYETLDKTCALNSESAVRILDNKAGDCSEHARLFVALARAAGLPAREVTGLLYVNYGKPIFGWHAWAEVHDGHQWVSVDPAWDQVWVDASHVRFVSGVADYGWVNVMGSLRLDVRGFQRAR